MKRVISILLTISIAFSLVSAASGSAYAAAKITPENCVEQLEKSVDLAAFRQTLANAFTAYQVDVNISAYHISNTVKLSNLLNTYIYYYMSEFINVSGLDCDYSSGYYTNIHVYYRSNYPANTFLPLYNRLGIVANQFFSGFENAQLSDEEKALLVHDRLIKWADYDYEEAYNGAVREFNGAYSLLFDHRGVCHDYSLTYLYLMQLLGIRALYVSSSRLNHAWNIIYIDDKPYYVDCTWDDSGNYYVGHSNFLRSQQGFFDTGHLSAEKVDYGPDFNMDNTKYDSYYWQKSYREMQLVGNKIYYINSKDGTIYLANTAQTALCQSDEESELVNDGQKLYYEYEDCLCVYNPLNQRSNVIFEAPTDSYLENLQYQSGKINFNISNRQGTSSSGSVSTSAALKSKIDVSYISWNGTVRGAGIYDAGNKVKLIAENESGYDFEGFYCGGKKLTDADSDNSKYTVEITADQNMKIEAKFNPCTHRFVKTTVVQPTCTQYGRNEVVCAICGYRDNDEYLAEVEHQYKTNVIQQPSCFNYGRVEKICSVCGKCVTEYTDPAHQWDKTSVIKPTCEEYGYTQKHCSVCENNYYSDYVEPTGHKMTTTVVAPTCGKDGYTKYYCTQCDYAYYQDYTAATKVHTWNGGEVTKAATCDKAGVKTYQCTVCGETKTESIAKLTTHSWDGGKVTKAATYKEEGVKTYTCKVCGATKQQAIAKLGKDEQPSTAKTDIAKASISGIKNKTYTGKAITQAMTVKIGSKTLKKDKDYTIKYTANKNVGKATVLISGKGAYKGSVKKSFNIVPKGTTLKKLIAAKKVFTAQWKQNKTAGGYQIQYSLKSNFAGAKSVTVKGNKTLKTTVKKLSAKKVYYVRVRTYKTVKKITYYSAWSKAVKVKTK